MSKRMIIDASHREETRVVVLDGNKVEEFDFEAASKRPLKGNIYLAKVTRVEPSLQAAFVEYGGNRQGFLAFAEIHPDYYQIPIADRMALLAEQEAEARRHADEDVESIETTSVPAQESAADAAASSPDSWPDAPTDEQTLHDPAAEPVIPEFPELRETRMEPGIEPEPAAIFETPEVLPTGNGSSDAAESHGSSGNTASQSQLPAPRPSQRWARKRHYKIQEVIKRRQIILVQVVKEERGNKGAALTTYLSLAGRYCVLMPNTPRGGGISRKITSAVDRTRLKSAAQSLELPEGMGLIIRTAGENRTKAEIKRDYEYLLRMWDTIRELTLKSNAPACVYEEGDLIKRAIRDLYNKDVSEIVVEGDDGYRNAKDFMRMLMPSHAKNVKPYKEPVPLFQRYQIESQLDAMFMPTVTLRSGGYIVINQTEALVSIDVNSGKATREHSIEDTAYKTNLEAAEEIGRQLRLRDLAGLIVIDFIDMEDARNDRNVEKRLRDCVKNDRARVQIGKISQFGLLEMSRQRLRAGVVAGSTVPCPHCGGQGIIRSVESTALRLLRGLEEEAQKRRATALGIRAPTEVAIYALNQKRREIARLESEHGLTVQFEAREDMLAGTFEIDRIAHRAPDDRTKLPVLPEPPALEPQESVPTQPVESDIEEHEPELQAAADAQPAAQSGKRRRRRRRGRDRTTVSAAPGATATIEVAGSPERKLPEPPPSPATSNNGHAGDMSPTGEQPRKRRRRRRGRRGSREDVVVASPEGTAGEKPAEEMSFAAPNANGGRDMPMPAPYVVPNAPSQPVWSLSREEAQGGTVPISSGQVKEDNVRESELAEVTSIPPQAAAQPEAEKSAEPARKGWWQRPFRARE